MEQKQSIKHDKMQVYVYENIKDIIMGLSKSDIDKNDIKILKIELEKPVFKTCYNSKTIVGYIDVFVQFEIKDSFVQIAIELKPKIYSLGELIRQVKTYETYCYKYIYAVLCYEDNYKNVIESQNIRFMKL